MNSNKNISQVLGITFGIALFAIFAPPFLSGSNHACPVLREKDLKHGQIAEAVPAFARKYNVDCTYCHSAWPQLNRRGYEFRLRGYRMAWEVPTHGSGAAPVSAPGASLSPGVNNGLKNAVSNAAKQAPSDELIAEGKKTFEAMQCFTCHINGGNIINPAKPLKGEKFHQKYPEDAQIANIIRHGVAGTAMPAYSAERLTDDSMAALIAYVRSLTPQQLP